MAAVRLLQNKRAVVVDVNVMEGKGHQLRLGQGWVGRQLKLEGVVP